MSRTNSMHGLWSGLLLLALPFAGCSGSDGAAGVSTAVVLGTVTNSANGNAPVANATITTSPAITGLTITTAADGSWTANLPAGVYSVTCAATNFTSQTKPLSVLAGVAGTLNFAMVPTAPVVLAITGAPTGPAPGATFDLTVVATPMNGSTVTGYAWTQTESAAATIANPTAATTAVTLADAAAYKANLLEHVHAHDRWAVLPIDPHAAELGAAAAFEVTVTTTSGTYHREIEVVADLPFVAWATGLRNVPLGLPVLLGGKDQATYDWSLAKPGSSAATLNDATTRFPWFVPDVAGTYTLSVTDIGASATAQIVIRAAAWQGGINGIDTNGRPTTSCADECHSTAPFFPEKFADWAASGHAEIFSANINTGDHYSANCFACHTVGFDAGASNSGFDDTADYAGFLSTMFAGGQSHMHPDNWETVVANWPNQARMANIQCENCHGPNGTGASHANAAASATRVSYSAAVCGYCHGEPPRHGRYQQWQESGHGNYETAIGEGTSASCAPCHSAQGFLAWSAAGFVPTFTGGAVSANEVEPITCVVCHDPHNVGTVSGDANNAPMRIQGDTPAMLMAGYRAYGLGKGAICIQCHNGRRGEAAQVLTTTPDRAPHGGTQGDVMMGENAFFVSDGIRGAHSLISNSCVGCHLTITPPPAAFSYNLSGTNHAFGANTTICSSCHGLFDASVLMAATDARMAALAEELMTAIEKEIAFHTAAGRSVRVTGLVNNVSTTTDITASSTVDVQEILDSHGRAAMVISIDSVVFHDSQINGNAQIIDGGAANGRLLANIFSSKEQILAQSLWNYFMVHNDSSSGIHNPGWVTEIIANTSVQLSTNWP